MKSVSPLFRTFAPAALGLVALGSLMEANSQTLQEAVGQAMASNPKIMAAFNDHKASNERVNQAISGFLPKIDGRLGTGREWTSSPSTRFGGQGGIGMERGEMGLTVNQMLFDGLSTLNRVDQTRAQARSSDATLQKTINQVTLDTIDIYLEALKQTKMLAVDDEAIAVLGEIVTKTEQMVTIGVGTEVDANQSRGRLVMARSDRTGTLKKWHDANARFAELTGSSPKSLVVPDIRPDLLPSSLEEAINQALHRAPTVSVSEAELDAVEAEKKMSTANLLPKVNLEMSLGDDANTSGTPSYTKSASAMVRMEYNLFRGGSDWFHRRELANRVYKSQEDLEQVRRQITKEVTSAWHDVKTGQELLELMEKNLDVRQHVAASYQEEHALGTRSHLDALNALNDVFAAKRSLVDQQFKQKLSICQLLSSMGVLPDTLGKFDSQPGRFPVVNKQSQGQETKATARDQGTDSPLPTTQAVAQKPSSPAAEGQFVSVSLPPQHRLSLTEGDILGADALILANTDLLFPTQFQKDPPPWSATLDNMEITGEPSLHEWADLAEQALLDYIGQMEIREQNSLVLLPFAIQVGEFVQEESTEAIIKQLSHKGYELFVRELRDPHGQIRQLAWVGGFRTRSEAQAALTVFLRQERIRGFVTTTASPPSKTSLFLSRIKPSTQDRPPEPNEIILQGMIAELELKR
ncbi:MAG: TolC family outer membrane protein [Magnetococcales bacterium]|nr:TolC family outer membrane protein [Magnetococcales bacterium]